MPYILDISTEVPEFTTTQEQLVQFYSMGLNSIGKSGSTKKISFLSNKTKIQTRYSCIPDFNGSGNELFTDNNFGQPLEKRMDLYKEKIFPLAVKTIDKLLLQTHLDPRDITHIITVTCTGLYAPGLELILSDYYGFQHAEKLGLNFLGCYAAIKALKHAHYIAQSNPDACILIISAELCTLHFNPSDTDEDIVANLLFADGAASAIVCGNASKHIQNKVVFNIDSIGSAIIPDTLELMTWNISSPAFKMFLSKNIVNEIKTHIDSAVNDFLKEKRHIIDYWAIHPGGIKIIEVVKKSLCLQERHVEDSSNILKHYGNMSSPTILFILQRIFNKIKNKKDDNDNKVFCCAFGPGVSIEMIQFTSVYMTEVNEYVNFLPKRINILTA